ncbi:MAG: hypothetical protein KAS70_02640, partial [Planctomycetes bacterium]|nr:hypothetical protein [Planctomycetota bacterium]
MTMRRIKFFIFLLVFIISPLTASAELIILNDGSKIKGDIISRTEEAVEIETDFGNLTIKRSNIKSIHQSVEVVIKDAEKDLTEARALLEKAIKIKSRDREAANTLLNKAILIVKKSKNDCMEVMDVYSGQDLK